MFCPQLLRGSGQILSQAESVGLNVPLPGGDGWDGLEELCHCRPAEGQLLLHQTTQRVPAPSLRMPTRQSTARVPQLGFAPLGYDTAKTVVYGVRAAEDAGLEAGTDKYKQAVNVPLPPGTIRSITGTFTFDEHHDPVKEDCDPDLDSSKPELKEMF